jgi:hypothetical protein
MGLLFSIITTNKFAASLKTLALHVIEARSASIGNIQCAAFMAGN